MNLFAAMDVFSSNKVPVDKEPKTDDVLPWLLLKDLDIKRFFASRTDLLTLSALIRNEGFADSRHDFLQASKECRACSSSACCCSEIASVLRIPFVTS